VKRAHNSLDLQPSIELPHLKLRIRRGAIGGATLGMRATEIVHFLMHVRAIAGVTQLFDERASSAVIRGQG
jgi:hypothetical protein